MERRFKVGDIVKVLVDDPHGSNLKKGDICRIFYINDQYNSFSLHSLNGARVGWTNHYSFELAEDFILKELWK